MKIVLRSLILLLLCSSFLVIMYRFGFLRFADIISAFEKRPSTLLFVAFVQLSTAVVMLLRYRALLSFLGLSASFKQMSAATFVSNAVGQWAPGSLAVVEVLRIGLMIGSQTSQLPTVMNRGETAGVKARLALASFADRALGFLGILLTGFVFSLFLLFFQEGRVNNPQSNAGLIFLVVTSGCGSASIIALPFLARLKVLRHFGRSFRLHGPMAHRTLGLMWNRFLGYVETMRHNIDAGSRHPQHLVKPLFLSVISLLLTSLSLYLAASALGESLSFLQIVCAYPLISLSTLLPLGFAGIGGYQLVMASIFALFSVSPAVVASSGVLQSALLLVVNTLVGACFAGVCAGQIKAIFRAQAPSNAN